MFFAGYAAIPEKGMQAIPDQLFSQLQNTTIHFNTRVEGIADSTIITSEGFFDFDAVIIATDPGNGKDYICLCVTQHGEVSSVTF